MTKHQFKLRVYKSKQILHVAEFDMPKRSSGKNKYGKKSSDKKTSLGSYVSSYEDWLGKQVQQYLEKEKRGKKKA
ncbi:MAG: hypothetical protein HYU39_06940 [Thaumarchaeota archaeon]|nr:hypothetical protein [Nitrososphaerota archaeon]